MKKEASLAATLSFIAGYVDTLGFIGLAGLFTAHVTGNFVLLGSELVRPDRGATIKLVAFPAFILAVALARVISAKFRQSGESLASLFLWTQAALLTAFMLTAVAALPIRDTSEPLPLLAGALGAAAMGLQNAAGRLVLSHLVPTTIMTGNVTQLVIDLVDLARAEGADDKSRQAAVARVRRMLPPIVAFAAGALCGALGIVSISFWALLPPILLLLWQGASLRQQALTES